MVYNAYNTIIILDAMRGDVGLPILESKLTGRGKVFDTGCNATFQWYNKYWATKNDYTLICENPMPWLPLTNMCHQNFVSAHKGFVNALEIAPAETLKIFENLQPAKTLLHFLPPHLPFVFGTGVEICRKAMINNKNIYGAIQHWGRKHGWVAIQAAYATQIKEMVNLLYANAHLFSGRKVLITADHGELIGYPDDQYDHPPNAKGEKAGMLRNVPWFEWQPDNDVLLGRLEMLGYH